MEEKKKVIKESQKRKKHSAVKRVVFLFWCVLFLCIGIGISFVIRAIEKSKMPTQKTVAVSPATECVAKACVWLSGVDEENWNYDKVSAIFSDLTVDVEGNYSSEDEKWHWAVVDPSYSECEELAYIKLGEFFRDMVIAQGNIEADEGTADVTKDVDAKLTELFGMPIAEYLKTCDIDLMPPKEDLVSKVVLSEEGGAADEK